MAAVYDLVNLGAFDAAEIRSFRQWPLADPPLPWEIAYNQWMLKTYHTSNPLITNPGKWENLEDAW
ncbi:hypothetical protein DIPPA_30672 [Diplonema papillatum]|nr:hypothetical protein DIPPA_30672 [Diplonema papillatum]